MQIVLRRTFIKRKRNKYKNIWPIHEKCAYAPIGWKGWPDHKQFALVLTHDVENLKGYKRINKLVDLEMKLGFRSSFNFVPKRYKLTSEVQSYLTANGFEIGVHGLYHDGKLYNSRKTFKKRAADINRYLVEWGAVGFRSPSMHRNLEWNCDLNIEYDSSTFDVDPFEPYPDGVCKIFPFVYEHHSKKKKYVELPYTLSQDFTLFILLRDDGITIWLQKLRWLAERRGMVLLNTHPDYMNFDKDAMSIEEYPSDYYEQFLRYINKKYRDKFWHVLPKEMAQFWKENNIK